MYSCVTEDVTRLMRARSSKEGPARPYYRRTILLAALAIDAPASALY